MLVCCLFAFTSLLQELSALCELLCVALLMKNLLVDDLWEHFKEYLVSVTTDGASNMQGIYSGFCRLLGETVGKQLICHHCLAHRLQLILRAVNHKAGVPAKCQNCVTLESVNNMLAAFYKQSPKRKTNLHIYCDARLKGFFPSARIAPWLSQ